MHSDQGRNKTNVKRQVSHRYEQQTSSVHPESGHSRVAAPSTGKDPLGHKWYEQKASQHCETSHVTPAQVVFCAFLIGV